MFMPIVEDPFENDLTVNGGSNRLEFPSLKDFETSNMYSGLNHNHSMQKHLDAKKLKLLD